MKIILCGFIAFLITGCASHTGIVGVGSDRYMIAKQQSSGFPGLGNIKAEIITEAVDFCKSKRLDVDIIESKETQPPYILGNYPRAEILFKCNGDNK